MRALGRAKGRYTGAGSRYSFSLKVYDSVVGTMCHVVKYLKKKRMYIFVQSNLLK